MGYFVEVIAFADLEEEELPPYLLGVPQGINGRDRGDDDDVSPGEEAGDGSEPQPLYLVVYVGFLGYVGVRLWNVGLRLVVVVVAYEVLYRILRKKFLSSP